MTKSTKSAPVAAAPVRKAKTVLTERDMLKPGQKTQAEERKAMEQELRKDRAALANTADNVKQINKAKDGLTYVLANDGRSVALDKAKLTAEVTKLLKVGASFSAVCGAAGLVTKGKAAELARGITGRQAPQSAAALQAARGAVKAAEGKSKAASAKGKLPPKTSLDPNAAIKLTDKGAARLRDGEKGKTGNLAIMSKAGTVGKALAGGLKGADITYAAKTGLITIG